MKARALKYTLRGHDHPESGKQPAFTFSVACTFKTVCLDALGSEGSGCRPESRILPVMARPRPPASQRVQSALPSGAVLLTPLPSQSGHQASPSKPPWGDLVEVLMPRLPFLSACPPSPPHSQVHTVGGGGSSVEKAPYVFSQGRVELREALSFLPALACALALSE